ncbi:histone-lysine N-methyltransferase SETMAR-like [Xylocopa sonorina]|uniref:histone-lysine N-methyltransferase SETMAR-like n=1 Tax=Xylocopa sonorina TaxID=1818115 RepID=UPI00403A89AB
MNFICFPLSIPQNLQKYRKIHIPKDDNLGHTWKKIMVANRVHYWHFMLFFFRKGKNATQAANKICAVYGEDAVAERTMRKWFPRFKAENFDLEDQERPGRPSTTDEDMIKTEIENNPCSTLRQLARMLNKPKSTIYDHTVKLGYVNRLDLYKSNEGTPFLKQLVTGNEKWIIYKNAQRKRSLKNAMNHL